MRGQRALLPGLQGRRVGAEAAGASRAVGSEVTVESEDRL